MSTTPIQSERYVWIGVVHVSGTQSSSLGAGRGAFAATVALASSAAEFVELVHEYMRKAGLQVLDIEDVELLDHRARTGTLDSELLALSSTLTIQAPVAVHTFDTYAQD